MEKKKGSIILLVLFFIGFFGSLALFVYASFHHYDVSKIASPTITFMLMVSGLYIKYIAPKVPTKEILIAVVILAVAEIISHIVGEKFPPAFFIADVLADVVIGGVFYKRWQKYL